MERLAADLAAWMIIEDQANEFYPVTVHRLDARVLFDLFGRITFQIATSIKHELGFPNFDAASQRSIREISKCVAYQALLATYSVTFKKGSRHLPTYFHGQHRPLAAHFTFPIYISTLINTIGPLQIGDYPAPCSHVPYLSYYEIVAQRPPAYAEHHLSRFCEKLSRSGYLTGTVEPDGTASNGWWTLWPVKEPTSIVVDYSNVVDYYVGETTLLPVITVFMPQKADQLEDHFKLAIVFAQKPLCVPGIGQFSATEWYEATDLENFDKLPTPWQFPAATREFPYYNESNRAVHAYVEPKLFTYQDVPAPSSSSIPAGGTDRTPGPSHLNRRRRLIPVDSPLGYAPAELGSDAPNLQEGQITQYRIVYLYFAARIINHVFPEEYLSWPIKLCRGT